MAKRRMPSRQYAPATSSSNHSKIGLLLIHGLIALSFFSSLPLRYTPCEESAGGTNALFNPFSNLESFPSTVAAFSPAPPLPVTAAAFLGKSLRKESASVQFHQTRLFAEVPFSEDGKRKRPSSPTTPAAGSSSTTNSDPVISPYFPASIGGIGGMDYSDSMSFLAQEIGMSDSQARAIAERIFAYQQQQQQQRRRPQQQQEKLQQPTEESRADPSSSSSSSSSSSAVEGAAGGGAVAASLKERPPPPPLAAAASPAASPADAANSRTMALVEMRRSLNILLEAGFQGSDVTKMILVCPELVVSTKAAQRAVEVAGVLGATYGLRRYDIRRVARSEPGLLTSNMSSIAATTEALAKVGLSGKYAVKMALIRWPALLMQPPQNVFRLADFLLSDDVGFRDAAEIGSFLKVAPWLVSRGTLADCVDSRGNCQMIAKCLTEVGGVHGRSKRARETAAAKGDDARTSSPMSGVIRAFPQVFDLDVATELTPRIRFLSEEVGIPSDDVPSVIQSFPLVLGLDVTTRMRPVIEYLEYELGIDSSNIAKICRAFPSLLGLGKMEHFVPAQTFLRSIGVQNVARFVQRIPPVLGYDVETNLEPKWRYLTDELHLTTYDITRFPAYFSYPLDTIIIPRTKYLKDKVNRPGSVWGLNLILTPTDSFFASKVAGTTPEAYKEFKNAFLAKVKARRAFEAKGQQLMREMKRDIDDASKVEADEGALTN